MPRQQPSIRLQASVGENQNASAAGSPSKPEDYHRVNTLFTSLDKVLAEIEDRFSGNDQAVLCDYYNLDKELLHGDQRLFNRFKKHTSKNQWSKRQMSLTHYMKTPFMKLHQSSRRWLLFYPSFPQHHAQRNVRSADSGGWFTFVTPCRNTMHKLDSLAIICIERAYGDQVIVNSIDKTDIFGQLFLLIRLR